MKEIIRFMWPWTKMKKNGEILKLERDELDCWDKHHPRLKQKSPIPFSQTISLNPNL
jgi:hypothetical protein